MVAKPHQFSHLFTPHNASDRSDVHAGFHFDAFQPVLLYTHAAGDNLPKGRMFFRVRQLQLCIPTGRCFHASFHWECRGRMHRVPGPQEAVGCQASTQLFAGLPASASALNAQPCCPVQQSSCHCAASSTRPPAAFAALRVPPLSQEQPLPWAGEQQAFPQCREASGEQGCSQQPPQGCGSCIGEDRYSWEQSLRVPGASSQTQTQQGSSALASPNKLETSFTSSCRVPPASMRWQLPLPHMRKQDQ